MNTTRRTKQHIHTFVVMLWYTEAHTHKIVQFFSFYHKIGGMANDKKNMTFRFEFRFRVWVYAVFVRLPSVVGSFLVPSSFKRIPIRFPLSGTFPTTTRTGTRRIWNVLFQKNVNANFELLFKCATAVQNFINSHGWGRMSRAFVALFRQISILPRQARLINWTNTMHTYSHMFAILCVRLFPFICFPWLWTFSFGSFHMQYKLSWHSHYPILIAMLNEQNVCLLRSDYGTEIVIWEFLLKIFSEISDEIRCGRVM